MEPRRVDLEALLNASNVSVEGEPPEGVAAGDYVAITVLGPGDWERDAAWTPASTELLWSEDVDAALRAASVSFAYLRRLGQDGGSIRGGSIDRAPLDYRRRREAVPCVA